MGYGAEDAMRLAMRRGTPIKMTPFEVVCLITERELNKKIKQSEIQKMMDEFLSTKNYDYITPDLHQRSKALLNNHQDEFKKWIIDRLCQRQ